MEILHHQRPEEFRDQVLQTLPGSSQRTELLTRLVTEDPYGTLLSLLFEATWRDFWIGEQLMHEILQLPGRVLDADRRSAYVGLLKGRTPLLPTTEELRTEFFQTRVHTDEWSNVLVRLMRWDEHGTLVSELIEEWRADRTGVYWSNAQIIRDLVWLCDRSINPYVWGMCDGFLTGELETGASDMLNALTPELTNKVQGFLSAKDQVNLSAVSKNLNRVVKENAKFEPESSKFKAAQKAALVAKTTRERLECEERASEADQRRRMRREARWRCLAQLDESLRKFDDELKGAIREARRLMYADYEVETPPGLRSTHPLVKFAAKRSRRAREYQDLRRKNEGIDKQHEDEFTNVVKSVNAFVDRLTKSQLTAPPGERIQIPVMCKEWATLRKSLLAAVRSVRLYFYGNAQVRVDALISHVTDALRIATDIQTAYDEKMDLYERRLSDANGRRDG